MHPNIQAALDYAYTLLGLPYRWYRKGEAITADDKFYAANKPAPVAADLFADDKCIVCTGVANLMRRCVGLPVPPAVADADIPFPGTTGTESTGSNNEDTVFIGTTDAWFYYLQKNNKLQPFDIEKALTNKYPKGSLLIRNFENVETEQGHVAILIDSHRILHAYAYDDTSGICGITLLKDSHYYNGHPGYYTHICLAEDWLT